MKTWIKILVLVVICILGVILLTGCSTKLSDTEQLYYDYYANIKWGTNSTLKVPITHWTHMSYGNITIYGVDGTQYTTHESNVVIVKRPIKNEKEAGK